MLSFLGNVVWFILGGWLSGLSWLVVGALWCITVVGIPYGLQCFKFAKLAAAPFGKEVEYGTSAGSLLMNILWIVLTGVPMAIEHAAIGLVLCVTIVGIPLGIQHFKMAKLALMPFGTSVVS
ncbi:MAG: YccF domain-containing protein [Roseburia sp.]|nr:YccF domain-containing protein [Roseburia sp.]